MVSPPSRWQMDQEKSVVVGWGTVGLVSPATRMLPMLLAMLTHPKPPIDCPTLGLSHKHVQVDLSPNSIHESIRHGSDWVRELGSGEVNEGTRDSVGTLAVGLVMFRPSLTRHVLWRIRRGGWESPLVMQTIHRFHNRFSQSPRRPLLGPSPG